jgi:hypothetical protein
MQRLNPFWWKQFRLDDQFEPQLGFICLFKNDAHFGDELTSGASATSAAIICSDGRATANELIGNRSSLNRFWQCSHELDNSQRELLRPQL